MNSLAKAVLITILTLIQFIATVILELIAAICVYVYFALYDLDTFGYLVSLSKRVLDMFTSNMEQFFPEVSNRAYATLLGELGPKSILLLLVGLTVGAALRFLFWGGKCAFLYSRSRGK